jgi:hypothetical protein
MPPRGHSREYLSSLMLSTSAKLSVRDQLLDRLSKFLTGAKVNLFVTSRYSKDIQDKLRQPILLEIKRMWQAY